MGAEKVQKCLGALCSVIKNLTEELIPGLTQKEQTGVYYGMRTDSYSRQRELHLPH